MNLHNLSEFIDKHPTFSAWSLILLVVLAGYALWIIAVLVRGWEPPECECDCDDENDDDDGHEEDVGRQ